MSKTYLLRLERDEDANPSLDVLNRLSEALDVTIADLVGAPSTQYVGEDGDIPSSLLAFADDAGLTSAEIQRLSSIRWRRGETPQTPERWRYIHNSLLASRQFDPDD